MLGLTCVPEKVYDYLYLFKSHFRCKQGRHFLLFCWLIVGLILDFSKGTIKGIHRLLPDKITYWALMRMLRSGLWDDLALIRSISTDVINHLPPPKDGTIYLILDSSIKGKTGKSHPLGHKCRINEFARFCFGFEFVLMLAAWGHYRIPVAIAIIDPKRKGHQNILARHMLKEFSAPAWAKTIIVVADAGFAANKTFKVIDRLGYKYVYAVARTRKFDDGKYLKDLVQHMPKKHYRRIKTEKPDGRRRDYWVYEKRASLKDLGDVTIVVSKCRRNEGPKKAKIIVTNIEQGSASQILSIYARRWGIEVSFKELKSGLHLGNMQVTKEAERVRNSVAIAVIAYLVLLRLYGRESKNSRECSLFRMKQRFIADVFHEQQKRSEHKWKARLDKLRAAA